MQPDWTSDKGDVQLYCADCLDVLPTLADGSVDAVVTDPMYGISTSDITRNSGYTLTRNFFDDDNADLGVVVVRVLARFKSVRSIFAFCGHRQFGGIVSCLDQTGFQTGPFFWVKTNSPPSVRKYIWRSCGELAVYGVRGDAFNWVDDDAAQNWRLVSCCTHGHPEKNGHPTQKPLDIIIPAVMATQESCMVLDPFMGSGTTGVACVKLGRRFIGIEKERKYFDIAVKRIQTAIDDWGLFKHERAAQ